MARMACQQCGSTHRITEMSPFKAIEDLQVVSICADCGKTLFTGSVAIVDSAAVSSSKSGQGLLDSDIE